MAETAPEAPTALYPGMSLYLIRSPIVDTAMALTYRNTYRIMPDELPNAIWKYCSTTVPKKYSVSILKNRCPQPLWTSP